MQTKTQSIILAAAFAIVGIMPTVEASEKNVSIVYNAASYHTDSRSYILANGDTMKYNQMNSGLGLAYAFDDNISGEVGQYRNSQYVNSNYAAIDFHTSNKFFNVGIAAGVVTGYKYSKYTPMFLPNVSATLDAVTLRVGYVPVKVFDKASSSVITFQLVYKAF